MHGVEHTEGKKHLGTCSPTPLFPAPILTSGLFSAKWAVPPPLSPGAPAQGALPFPQDSISAIWKVLGLDLCHSVDAVTRV